MTSDHRATLTTERLILRAYRDADFDAYRHDVDRPRSSSASSAASRSHARKAGTGSSATSACGSTWGSASSRSRNEATGAFVGEVGFQERRRDIVPSMEGTLETGWGLRPAAHGKGYRHRGGGGGARLGRRRRMPGARYTALIDGNNSASLRVAREVPASSNSPSTVYHGVAAQAFRALASVTRAARLRLLFGVPMPTKKRAPGGALGKTRCVRWTTR